MIHKNFKIGKSNMTLLEFGKGSISMQPAYFDKEKHPALLMKTDNNGHSVGDESKEYHNTNSDVYKPEIAMVFANEKSLDALISSLEDCRKYFKPETP